MITSSLCSTCFRTWRGGKRIIREARYLWVFPDGNMTLLCVECCACWRANAAADPSLAPARITDIEIR